MSQPTASAELNAFLTRNRIGTQTWEKAQLDWEVLQLIARDHLENRQRLLQSAEMFAKIIQSFPGVHSVRWRVKDTDHLLEKIVRKRVQGATKYETINAENYFNIVTDLVGIRALHLFKTDCLDIDPLFRATWKAIERPVAYIRAGDHDELVNKFKANDFDVKEHPAGYRSVHYVFESQPLLRRVLTEVQVRTVFEEGWSEIDHHVRYPNFSENELVGYFLTIFNRMAGSADEMGGFVRGLAATLEDLGSDVATANAEKAASIAVMEKATSELEDLRKQGKESSASIAKLRSEIEKLKRASAINVSSPSSPPISSIGNKLPAGSTATELLLKMLSSWQTLKATQDIALASAIKSRAKDGTKK